MSKRPKETSKYRSCAKVCLLTWVLRFRALWKIDSASLLSHSRAVSQTE